METDSSRNKKNYDLEELYQKMKKRKTRSDVSEMVEDMSEIFSNTLGKDRYTYDPEVNYS